MNIQVNLAQIRFNTESNGHDKCWRLVLDGEEILVESVNILAPFLPPAIGLNPSANSNTIFLLLIAAYTSTKPERR